MNRVPTPGSGNLLRRFNYAESCLSKKKFEDLLRRKAALGQDMVFADENGKPRIVSARQALADYEARKAAENNSEE